MNKKIKELEELKKKVEFEIKRDERKVKSLKATLESAHLLLSRIEAELDYIKVREEEDEFEHLFI